MRRENGGGGRNRGKNDSSEYSQTIPPSCGDNSNLREGNSILKLQHEAMRVSRNAKLYHGSGKVGRIQLR